RRAPRSDLVVSGQRAAAEVSPTVCRGCGHLGLRVVLDLGRMPLANSLLSDSDLGDPEPRYPLALAFCSRCCLVQITEPVPPPLMFRDYKYFSSVSEAMVEHSQRLSSELILSRSLDAR